MASSTKDVQRIVTSSPLFFFDNTLDAKVVLDNEGRFVLVNKRVEEVTGYSKEELIGKKFFETDLLTLKSKAVCVEKFLAHMNGTMGPAFEIEALTKTGDKLHYELNATSVTQNGKIIGIYVGLRDLSERKKIEGEVKRVNQKLKELIAMISHDLKYNVVSLKASLQELKPFSKDGRFHLGLQKTLREADVIYKVVSTLMDKIERLGREPL